MDKIYNIFLALSIIIGARQVGKSYEGKAKKVLFFIIQLAGIIFIIAALPSISQAFDKYSFDSMLDKYLEEAGYSSSVSKDFSKEEWATIVISIAKCWGKSEEVKGYPIVIISVSLNPDTSIKTINVIDAEKERYINDDRYRKAADYAINSLKTCAPLTFLPKEKYDLWKDMDLKFDAQTVFQ